MKFYCIKNSIKIKIKQWICGFVHNHEFKNDIYDSCGLLATECIRCGKYVSKREGY